MKQVIQNYKSGEMSLSDAPAPQLRPEGVLVRTAFSLISAGTERSMVEMARKNLLEKAWSRPDLVRKVLDKSRTEGLLSAYKKAMLRLSTETTLGYSSAGTVMAVGSKVQDLRVGMKVACGGIGYASHSEIVYLPRNLCVRVPDTLDLREAAFTTLGSIALQGVRSAGLNLGEVAAVIGLGLVGLLTVQILKAGGCLVVGIDPDSERCKMAAAMGADATGSDPWEQEEACRRLSGGLGADAVLITAATTGSGPVELAGELARDRARIVVVGQVGMALPRKLYYEKELSLAMSRSYGPGRYDRSYEEKGIDYPAGYVRWTENRNMSALVNLMAERKLDVRSLITHEFPLDRALGAYEVILSGRERYLGVLLTYEGAADGSHSVVQLGNQQPAGTTRQPVRAGHGQLGIGVIGSGNFGSAVILPALQGQRGIDLRGICSQRGLSARSVGNRWKFDYCTSDPEAILNDDRTHGVVICTRPDSHAELICAALEAGKHVFVEKPLAVSLEQLREIRRAVAAHPSQVLMVGFNRRFAPFTREVAKFMERRGGPLMAVYRVNAGYLPPEDWQHDAEQGAGRIVGESGHFLDTLCYLTGSTPEEVFATSISGKSRELCAFENASLNLRFADGSLGVILYTTHGSPAFSKERLEVFADGSVAVIDDFRHLELVKKGSRRKQNNRLGQDKGHAAELAAFLEGVRKGGSPVDPEVYFQITLCTLQAVESLRSGQPEKVAAGLLDEQAVAIPEDGE
jgi:predicted dehydrogenase/threonine dehydrogenase-like Zn-dependent dehydrogenase